MKKKNKILVVVLSIIFVIGSIVFFLVKNLSKDKSSENQISSPILTEDKNDQNQESRLAKFEYKFNPHVISKEFLEIYGPEIERLFYGFCDAVLEAKDTFDCPSLEVFNQILVISRTCLPIASQYIDKDKIFVKNGVGHISYKIGKDELKNNVEKFKEKVTNFIASAIPYKEDNFIIAMELLKAIANKDKFDTSGDSPDNALKLQPYRAIMENIGICQEISGEYIYYLLQVGINAITCSGLSKNKSFAHEWVVAELDGEHYHIDPTFTIEHKDSLAFFCLNDAGRVQYGDFDIKSFSFADSSKINYKINSERFKELWSAETYTIDREKRKIHMKIFYSGEDKEYDY